jgi:hypothetical protein
VGFLWDPCGILVGSLWDPCGIFGGKSFPWESSCLAFLGSFPRPKTCSPLQRESFFGLGNNAWESFPWERKAFPGKAFPPKNPTRIPQGSHKDPTRIPQGSHKDPTDSHKDPQGFHNSPTNPTTNSKATRNPTRLSGQPGNPTRDSREPQISHKGFGVPRAPPHMLVETLSPPLGRMLEVGWDPPPPTPHPTPPTPQGPPWGEFG